MMKKIENCLSQLMFVAMKTCEHKDYRTHSNNCQKRAERFGLRCEDCVAILAIFCHCIHSSPFYILSNILI